MLDYGFVARIIVFALCGLAYFRWVKSDSKALQNSTQAVQDRRKFYICYAIIGIWSFIVALLFLVAYNYSWIEKVFYGFLIPTALLYLFSNIWLFWKQYHLFAQSYTQNLRNAEFRISSSGMILILMIIINSLLYNNSFRAIFAYTMYHPWLYILLLVIGMISVMAGTHWIISCIKSYMLRKAKQD